MPETDLKPTRRDDSRAETYHFTQQAEIGPPAFS
jgi:hypothetical protein